MQDILSKENDEILFWYLDFKTIIGIHVFDVSSPYPHPVTYMILYISDSLMIAVF